MIIDYRASKILFNFLKSNTFQGKFIIPANTCPIVPLTFQSAAVPFSFIDISTTDYCLDTNKFFELIPKMKICGLVWIRSYGLMASNTEEFFLKIKTFRPDIVIIDDKCLCRPTTIQEKTLADLTIYSTGYGKYLDLGKGAFAFLNNCTLKYKKHYTTYTPGHEKEILSSFYSFLKIGKKFEKIQNYSWLGNDQIEDEIFLHEINESLPQIDQHKKEINVLYSNNLPCEIQLNDSFQNWRFNITVPEHKKNQIISALFNAKLFASSHYASIPVAFGLPNAKIATSVEHKIINLFNDFHYNHKMAIETCNIINKELTAR